MSSSNAESVHGRYSWSNTSPTIAVITAIAAIENVKPINLHRALGTTLYDRIDPDALDSLVTNETHITISFTIDRYRIRIDGNELIIRFD